MPPNAAILLVEDHDDIRSTVANMLAHEGHLVLQARDVAEALVVIEQGEREIDLAVVKATLAAPGSPAVIERLRGRRTPLRLILISEYPAEVLRRMPLMASLSRASFNGFRYLAKPFSQDALARAVAELLARPEDAVQALTMDDGRPAD